MNGHPASHAEFFVTARNQAADFTFVYDFDAVAERYTTDKLRQLIVSLRSPPAFRRRRAQNALPHIAPAPFTLASFSSRQFTTFEPGAPRSPPA